MHTYVNAMANDPNNSDEDYDEGYEHVQAPMSPPNSPPISTNMNLPRANEPEVPAAAVEFLESGIKRRKILISVGCTLINFCQSVVFAMAILGKINSDLSEEQADDIRMALVITRRLGVPVASLLMIGLGYRVVGIMGCSFVGLGLFIAAWVPRVAVGGIGFLVGGVAGIGFALLSLTVIVPILETFKKHRLRYVVLVRSADAVAAILFACITFIPEINIDWRILYRYQLIVMVIAGAACVLLKPVTEQTPVDKSQGVRRLLGLTDYSIFKDVALYLLMVVYFMDQVGKPIPVFELKSILQDPMKQFGDDLSVQIIVILPFVGVLVGLLSLVFWHRFSLVDVLWLLGPVNILSGLLTFQAPALSKVAWVAVYAVTFGMASGVFIALVDNVIPHAFGKQRIRIVEGILGLASGVGHVISLQISDTLDTRSTIGYESSFYLSGSALLTSGLLAVGFRFVLLRKKVKKENDR
ncbi:monocarboxylate transporter 12-B-like [Argopecten irradians]|uniref:monocarboxylate transporter 12-B-like n=1 Tax=Argopecten irradians TaxID=31199 RepID=UPI00371954C0